MILLAILLPWLSFLIRGKIFAGIFCLILQITLIGWLPAAIWAVVAHSNEKTQNKLNQIHRSVNSNSNNVINQQSYNQLSDLSHQLYNNKDYNGAKDVLLKLIALNPRDSRTYFNLACCYSLSENKQGFNALSNAVINGYSNLERIRTYEALSWLRNQPEYNSFLQNGYKLYIDSSTINTSNQTRHILGEIEKLGQLKEKGLITEDEFNEQKKRILNTN
jgi:hypothetical protein